MATITQEEYDRWYPPSVAVEVLKNVGFDPATVYSSILYRVTADELRAVAEKLIKSAPHYVEQTLRFALLTSDHWAVTSIKDSFWDSGDAIFRKRHKSIAADFTYACTGVRFDPAGIDKLAAQKRSPPPPALPASPPLRTLAKPKLSGIVDKRAQQEEFDRWLPPSVALTTLGVFRREVAIDAILLRLRHDELRALAGKGSIDNDGAIDADSFILLGSYLWEIFDQTLQVESFWDVGDVVFRPRNRHGVESVVACLDVRFDPAGIQKLFPSPPKPQSPVAATRSTAALDIKPNEDVSLDFLARTAPELVAPPIAARPQGEVQHAEIVAWVEALSPAEQQMSGKNLWELSKAAFHPRRVFRKQFDWLTESRDPGPRKRK